MFKFRLNFQCNILFHVYYKTIVLIQYVNSIKTSNITGTIRFPFLFTGCRTFSVIYHFIASNNRTHLQLLEILLKFIFRQKIKEYMQADHKGIIHNTISSSNFIEEKFWSDNYFWLKGKLDLQVSFWVDSALYYYFIIRMVHNII